MSLDIVYSIKRLLPADLKTLYTRCPPSERLQMQTNPFAADFQLSVNSEKGGLNVSEHVVYGCLADLPWTLAMEAALQHQPWHCAQCDFELEHYDVPDQLLHRLECKGRRESRHRATPEPKDNVATSSCPRDANYHCESCGRSLKLSQIDILRHRRQCVRK